MEAGGSTIHCVFQASPASPSPTTEGGRERRKLKGEEEYKASY